MKFSWKLFLWTISIVAISLAFGGYYLVGSFFQSALSRETKQALDENGIIRFALETATLNIPLKYETLHDVNIRQIGATLDTGSQNPVPESDGLRGNSAADIGGQNRYIRISGEDMASLYESNGFRADNAILSEAEGNELAYKITEIGGRYYIQTAVKVNATYRELYLETLRDVTNVFDEREAGFSVYRRVCMFVLLCEGIIIFLLSRWLTRPVRLLSAATKRMSERDYAYRARRISNDELGGLTEDFNKMAASLEKNVEQLEEAARSREEFVGVFAHELKTPLTAIIGYADMLRSQKMDEETQILSANYIYQEGKRLEKLSFDLLDIIVLKQAGKPSAAFSTESVFAYIRDTFSKSANLALEYEDHEIIGDASLIKTLLANLIDNSIKASEPNEQIEVSGKSTGSEYVFAVADHGCGISKENIGKITEAFYTVDKSRSRSRHGAGLGLTLCAEIAKLHGTKLQIESELGLGTRISFALIRYKEGRRRH